MNLYEKILGKVEERLFLPETGSWPDAWHRFDNKQVYATIAALKADRPLLVRGEPGIGKSQLARAVARLLERRFIATVIQPHTEYQELLWSIDHTRRLADAQLVAHTGKIADVEAVENYIGPGPMWYALNWRQAEEKKRHHNYRPPPGEKDAPDPIRSGVVLLIDEVDKADISLANGLLEVLGNGKFDIPFSKPEGEPQRKSDQPPPVVVFTSNDTRELPAAFVRRCVVLDLKLPKEGEALIAHLVEIGRTHYPAMASKVLEKAASQINADRLLCRALPKTGQAEFLDLLKALDAITQDAEAQLEWLSELEDYFHKSGVHNA